MSNRAKRFLAGLLSIFLTVNLLAAQIDLYPTKPHAEILGINPSVFNGQALNVPSVVLPRLASDIREGPILLTVELLLTGDASSSTGRRALEPALPDAELLEVSGYLALAVSFAGDFYSDAQRRAAVLKAFQYFRGRYEPVIAAQLAAAMATRGNDFVNGAWSYTKMDQLVDELPQDSGYKTEPENIGLAMLAAAASYGHMSLAEGNRAPHSSHPMAPYLTWAASYPQREAREALIAFRKLESRYSSKIAALLTVAAFRVGDQDNFSRVGEAYAKLYEEGFSMELSALVTIGVGGDNAADRQRLMMMREVDYFVGYLRTGREIFPLTSSQMDAINADFAFAYQTARPQTSVLGEKNMAPLQRFLEGEATLDVTARAYAADTIGVDHAKRLIVSRVVSGAYGIHEEKERQSIEKALGEQPLLRDDSLSAAFHNIFVGKISFLRHFQQQPEAVSVALRVTKETQGLFDGTLRPMGVLRAPRPAGAQAIAGDAPLSEVRRASDAAA